MAADKEKRLNLLVRIFGKVQGVWYRAWTCREAEKLGLDGWVRNRLDGTVEAQFVGPASQVEAMLCLTKEGPPAARVERVEVESGESFDEKGFSQKPTL